MIGTKIRYRNKRFSIWLAVSTGWPLTFRGTSPGCAEGLRGRGIRLSPGRRGSLRRCCCSWWWPGDSAASAGETGNGIAGASGAPEAESEGWGDGALHTRGYGWSVPIHRPRLSRRSGGCCGPSPWWWTPGAPGSHEWSSATRAARCRHRSYGKLSPPGSIRQRCRVGDVKGKKMEGSKGQRGGEKFSPPFALLAHFQPAELRELKVSHPLRPLVQ